MVTLLDGGTGRELKRMGAPFRQPEWSALALMEAPEFVGKVHRAFIDAGADVISTNSYALVPFHIGADRFARDGDSLIRLAGRIAREAADASDRKIRVAGSLPPVCGSYRPDLFETDEARRILTALATGLAPWVDLWLAETLSSVQEADLVRAVIGRNNKPLWLSFTLQDEGSSQDAPRLRSGEPVAAAMEAAQRLGAEALLFNCSQPEAMGAALSAVHDARGRMRVGVYANAFPPTSAQAEANGTLSDIRADLTPPHYLVWAKDWIARGADIVGGCCGIAPEHIHTIHKNLRSPPR